MIKSTGQVFSRLSKLIQSQYCVIQYVITQEQTWFLATVYFFIVTDLDRSLMYIFYLPKQYNEAVKHEANKKTWFCTAIVAHSHILSLLTSGRKKI